MINQHDLAILSRALSTGIISARQFADILRGVSENPQATIQSLLASRVGMSQDQLSSLLSKTENQARFPDETAAFVPSQDEPSDNKTTELTGEKVPRPAGKPTAGGTAETVDSGSQSGSADAHHQHDTGPLDSQASFELKREIGRGGLGRIMLAQDAFFGRDVAVKQLLRDARQSVDRVERFFLEAQLTGQLEHPGIVPVHALGVSTDGQPFYAMKYIKGRNLWNLIVDYHELDPSDPKRVPALHEMLRALAAVCNAAAFAHHRGVLHRDIKPQNIMVGNYGETLLVDWGLAKVFSETDAGQRQRDAAVAFGSSSTLAASEDIKLGGPREETIDGAVLGTIPYMSPEQARGAVSSLDHGSDIYALGATLYTILCGRPPYLGKGKALLEDVRRGEFDPPRKVSTAIPKPLEAICLKAMDLSPQRRYASAREMAADIARWQSGEPVEAYPEPLLDRAWRWMKKHRTSCVATTVAVLVVLMALGAWRTNVNMHVAQVERRGRSLLQEGQDAFGRQDLALAANKFNEANGLVSPEPGLNDLQMEIGRWIDQTNSRLAAEKARTESRGKVAKFSRLHDDAMISGMLAAGVDPAENTATAKRSVAEALSLFALKVDEPADPSLDGELYSEREIDRLTTDCRQLRWIYADALARPLPEHTQEQRVDSARRALRFIDNLAESTAPTRAYHLRRAFYLRQASDTAAAKIEMQKAHATAPAGAEDHFLEADFNFRHENFAAAAEGFQQALRLDPEHFWAQYFLGASHLKLGNWPEATASLTAAAARRSDLVFVYLLRGFAYGEMGRPDDAEADFKTAERLDAGQYGLYLNRGVVRLRHGKTAEAVDDFQTAIEINPKAPQAYVNLAEAQRLQEQYDEALTTLDKALAADPDSARAYRLKALVNLDMKDDPAAMKALGKALATAASGSRLAAALHCLRGRVLHRQGRREEALAEYRWAMREDADYPRPYHLAAIALMDLGKDAEAVAYFDKYLAESDLLSRAYDLSATTDSQPTPAGLAAFEADRGQTIQQADPRRLLATVYRERGLAHKKLGNSTLAMDDFARAVELVPELDAFPQQYDRNRFGTMHSRRGWAYLLEAKRLALAEFNEGIEIDPQNSEPYSGRGYAYIELGDYRKAIADAEKAVALGSGNPGLYFNVACIQAQAARQAADDDSNPSGEETAQRCRAAAISALRTCFEKWPEKREFYIRQAQLDTALDPLRDSDEFKELLKQ